MFTTVQYKHQVYFLSKLVTNYILFKWVGWRHFGGVWAFKIWYFSSLHNYANNGHNFGAHIMEAHRCKM